MAYRSPSGPPKVEFGGIADDDDTREGSAQASADFLLLMADPGHIAPDNSQQGSEACLSDGVLNPVPTAAHHDSSTLRGSVPINFTSAFVSESSADLIIPEAKYKPQPVHRQS